MFSKKTFSFDIGGKPMILEVGKMAHQANGACIVSYGETVVLATAVMSSADREGLDYFPLMVEYEERMYAAGRIKGSRFIKREGRPTDDAVISGRMIDRALRPLFNDKIRRDVQVIPTILSVDGQNESDMVAFVACIGALMISDIPWDGPLGALRIGQINGEWVINPTNEARQKSVMDVVVAGTADKIVMLEAEAKEVPEETIFEALEFARKHLGKICDFLVSVQKEIGKPKQMQLLEDKTAADSEETKQKRAEAMAIAEKIVAEKIETVFDTTLTTKGARGHAIGAIEAAVEQALVEAQIGKERRAEAAEATWHMIETAITKNILDRERRVDGRKLDEIRDLSAEVGLLPRTHGSGLFSRGETQILSVVTLGAPGEEQVLDGMEDVGKKRYMHHYNFPPFSVGEAKPLRGTGRREVGHGALAEKALEPVLPEKEAFPYTIRVVSEVMGSNGSSSQGSICGSTLALMDAGVPLKRPVAGIAMGLASESDAAGNITRYKVLTDLQDLEDGNGGMDFKVGGTELGITSIQLDTKTKGLQSDITKETLQKAKVARMQILDVMKQAIATPRAELSQYAPRIETVKISKEKIGTVIGPGGKMINEIIEACGVAINIEEDGTVFISGVGPEGIAQAVAWVKALTEEPEVGKEYTGKVTRIMDFGAFVEILPKKDAMVHISQLCNARVGRVTDVLQEGMEVTVRLMEIDDMGRLNASLKAVEGNDELYCKNLPPAPEGGNERGGFDRPRGGDRGERRGFDRDRRPNRDRR